MEYIVRRKGREDYLKTNEEITVISNDVLRTEKELKKFSFTTTIEKRMAKRFGQYSMAEQIRRELNLQNNIGIKWVIETI